MVFNKRRTNFQERQSGNRAKSPVKRLTSIFKKPDSDADTSRIRMRHDDDEATPPASPYDDAEPISVSIVQSPCPHEDYSVGGTTISDLSASVMRHPTSRYKHSLAAPIQEVDEESKTTRQTKFEKSSHDHPDPDSSAGCSPQSLVSNLFGFLDESCLAATMAAPSAVASTVGGSVKNSTESQDASQSKHTWGTAPSRDPEEDDDEDDDDTLFAFESRTGGNSLATEEREKSPSAEAAPSPDRTERSHENYELVLDPSILEKSAVPKRKKMAAWFGKHDEKKIEDEEVDLENNQILLHPKAPVTPPAKGERRRHSPSLPPLGRRSPNTLTRAKSLKTSDKVRKLTANLIRDGELLGEECLDEDEVIKAPEIKRSTSVIEELLREADEEIANAVLQESNVSVVAEEESVDVCFEEESPKAVMEEEKVEEQLKEPETKPLEKEPAVLKEKNHRVNIKALKSSPLIINARGRSWSALNNAIAKRRSRSSDKKKTTAKAAEPIDSSAATTAPINAEEEKQVAPATVSKPKVLWKSAKDPKSGRLYYYHRLTRKTTWTKPENFDSQIPDEQELKVSKSVFPSIDPTSSFIDAMKAVIPTECAISPTTDMSAEKQKMIDAGQSPAELKCVPILKKTQSRGTERSIADKKDEILRLLTAMSPPDKNSITKLMNQYAGREDELLEQLHEIAKKPPSQPFDEPVKVGRSFDAFTRDEEQTSMSPLSATSLAARTGTAKTSNTANTGATQKIKNTGKQDTNVFESIFEGDGDEIFDDESISSNNASDTNDISRPADAYRSRIEQMKKKIASGRTRDLRVEEFSSSRLTTESYDMQATVPRLRKPNETPGMASIEHSLCDSSSSDSSDDNDETDEEDTYTDTVSALGESDAEFNMLKDKFDRTTKSALDDAIRRRDWELAASVTHNIRNDISFDSEVHHDVGTYHEWTQSELDQFISENDWDAVAKYIAQMRDNNDSKIANPKPRNGDRLLAPSPAYSMSSDGIKKRFGARSQLQHQVENDASASSLESDSSSESDEYSSASSISETYGNNNELSRREFAC